MKTTPPSRFYIYLLFGPMVSRWTSPLHWRHNYHDGVSNHRPHGCFLNRLFRRRSKKTRKLRITGLCAGNSPGPVNSPHKWPVTRKMYPFDDVIVVNDHLQYSHKITLGIKYRRLPNVTQTIDRDGYVVHFLSIRFKRMGTSYHAQQHLMNVVDGHGCAFKHINFLTLRYAGKISHQIYDDIPQWCWHSNAHMPSVTRILKENFRRRLNSPISLINNVGTIQIIWALH